MEKIIIIKLGADGDVLRTLPIAKALKKKYPNSEITWVTRGDIYELLVGIPYISWVFTLPFKTSEKFDLLYNFDLENEATSLALKINADKKFGFSMEDGFPKPFNTGAEYYINTMFDDELKKSNRKTYQEMMFEAAELPYSKEDYEIVLTEKDKKYAEEFKKNNNIGNDKLIGIHIGASLRWPSKTWHSEKIKEFIIKASEKEYKIILFAGPNEAKKHEELTEELSKLRIKIYRNNPSNTKREFAALVSMCNIMVCSDSFSLHLSLGLKKPTIGLFFCTSPSEVESYGLLKKVISPMLFDFFPEKMNEYSENLINSISTLDVLKMIEEFGNNNK